MKAFDAQAAFGFLVSQTTHIEREVYQIKYADIQYPSLVPVDFSAHPFAKTVTYYSMNKAGEAKWLNGNSDDIPMVDTEHTQFETAVYTAGIGYGYGYEELKQAQMLGIPLTSDKGTAARRAYEEMVDRIALEGDTTKGFAGGLFNYNTVVATPATNGDWGSTGITPDEIIADVNDALTTVQVATNNVVLADTLIMPYSKWNLVASTRLTDTGNTILSFIRANNVYTAQTGQPLTIRAARKLDTAGVSGATRMVAYRRAPEVLKLHIPMPLQYLPVWQSGPLRWDVPGLFRLGGLDIRLPSEVSYIDGI